MNITISIAFFAGLISFLSPCVLPLIPGYISYISGTSLDKIDGAAHCLVCAAHKAKRVSYST